MRCSLIHQRGEGSLDDADDEVGKVEGVAVGLMEKVGKNKGMAPGKVVLRPHNSSCGFVSSS